MPVVGRFSAVSIRVKIENSSHTECPQQENLYSRMKLVYICARTGVQLTAANIHSGRQE